MERTVSAYLGRVMAVTMMAFGVNSIASYPVGLIADAIGERAMLGGLSCACLLVVSAGVLVMRSAAGQSIRPHAPAINPLPPLPAPASREQSS
jgi:hypothetical protein